MAQLLGNNEAIMKDPAKGLAPMRLNAMEGINARYAGSGDRVQAALAKRGYQSSGKGGAAFAGLERSRLSDMSGLESDFSKMASDRQMQASQAIQQVLQTMRGSTTTGPGNPGAGLSAAGSSLGNLSGLMMMSKMLGGFGGGGGGSTPQYYDMYDT